MIMSIRKHFLAIKTSYIHINACVCARARVCACVFVCVCVFTYVTVNDRFTHGELVRLDFIFAERTFPISLDNYNKNKDI